MDPVALSPPDQTDADSKPFAGQTDDDTISDPPSASTVWPFGLPLPIILARIRRERILENLIRRRIVAEVRSRPGVHHRELLRTLAVSNGTLAYHLRILEREGYVRSCSAHGRKYLFTPEDKLDLRVLQTTDRGHQILSALAEGREVGIGELGRRIGMAESTVEYHLGKLRTLGLVRARREGHALVFFRAPAL